MKDIEKIIQIIDERLSWKKCTSFYIGKTSDFESRRLDHTQNENFNYCWELAEGSSEQINNLENSLIQYYKEKKEGRLSNQNAGSGGNPKANTLYVAFRFEDIVLEELQDNTLPIANGFPIKL